VLHGDHDRDYNLELQGSIKAGLIAGALSEDEPAAVLTVDLPSCRNTAEKVHEKHPGIPFRTVEGGLNDWDHKLAQLAREFAGRRIVLVIDEAGAHHLFCSVEGLEPDEAPRHPLSPGGITRITLRPTGAYSMRLNNTEHLDGITDSDRFRML
jgi:broad specificity phosphatase PhoE